MNKRKLHHFWTLLRKVRYYWLLGLCLISATVALVALRHNNQTMVQLKAAVFIADEKDGDVETALKNLREYVYKHLNTNLAAGANAVRPPIQLKYRYERLVAAEKAKVEEASSKIYTDAQTSCEQRFPAGLSGSNRIPCIKEYVDSHGVTAKTIPEEQYKFDFVSPAWTPDLAGWSIVATVFFFLLFVLRFLGETILRYELRGRD